MRSVLLAVVAFALTWAESVVCIKGGRADRQSTYCATSRKSSEAALYAGLHEAVLVAYGALVYKESLWLAIPVIAASLLSTRWALERRRKKWRANAGKRRRKKMAVDKPAESA